MAKIALLSILFLSSPLLTACERSTHAAPVAPTSSNAAPKVPLGSKAKCPVSGEEFTVGEETKQTSYKGKQYAFCCPDCQPTFLKNPGKYAK